VARQRLVIISNLYPLPWEPNRATFNRQQFSILDSHFELSILVPVPFVDWFKHYKQIRQSDKVRYSPYFFLPKLGRRFYALWMLGSLLLHAGFWLKRRKPDIMLASWAFPDAVATRWLARLFRCRFFFKVHGSDIHLHGQVKPRAKQIVAASQQATKVIAVSEDLKTHMVAMGIAAEKIQVVYNGVDHTLFNKPAERNIATPYLLFVGNLKKDKGVMELLLAFNTLSREFGTYQLIIAGSGAMQDDMQNYVNTKGLCHRVQMLGNVAHAQLPALMQHADLLVLPSYHEGVPNVILESMASGTPVVATDVGGIAEIVRPDVSGLLVAAAEPMQLAEAIRTALQSHWDRPAIRQYARQFNWQKNTALMLHILK
jgi:glycosyltransferase involved in cell wall biosynthesis